MAIEVTIKQGDQAAENKDFLGAISKYTAALKESPTAFTALIKRAQTYTKLCDYDAAKKDISQAFTVAENRGKMELRAECHYRLALVNYSEKNFDGALVNFTRAKELHSKEAALDIWLEKAKRDKKKAMEKEESEKESLKETGSKKEGFKKEDSKKEDLKVEESSSSIDTINKQAPISAKIRDEWYQTKDRVTVTIYAKDVPKESVQVDFGRRSLSIVFPTSASSDYSYSLDRLYGEVDPKNSTFSVTTKKIEVVLAKVAEGKWAALEGDGPVTTMSSSENSTGLAYPTSSKKNIDWASFDVKEEEDESEDFFEKLYKDVDEDTRRAMMKSYVESNGTVLTTNWAEAKSKTFETSPPEEKDPFPILSLISTNIRPASPDTASVIVTGNFDDWSQSGVFEKNGDVFEAVVSVPEKQKLVFKFIVNGSDWATSESYPGESDEHGNWNNYVAAEDLVEVAEETDVKQTESAESEAEPVTKAEVSEPEPTPAVVATEATIPEKVEAKESATPDIPAEETPELPAEETPELPADVAESESGEKPPVVAVTTDKLQPSDPARSVRNSVVSTDGSLAKVSSGDNSVRVPEKSSATASSNVAPVFSNNTDYDLVDVDSQQHLSQHLSPSGSSYTSVSYFTTNSIEEEAESSHDWEDAHGDDSTDEGTPTEDGDFGTPTPGATTGITTPRGSGTEPSASPAKSPGVMSKLKKLFHF